MVLLFPDKWTVKRQRSRASRPSAKKTMASGLYSSAALRPSPCPRSPGSTVVWKLNRDPDIRSVYLKQITIKNYSLIYRKTQTYGLISYFKTLNVPEISTIN